MGIIVLYGGDQCICSTSLWLVVMHACVWSCSYNITSPYFKLNSGNNKRHPSPIYSEMCGTGPWFFKKSKYGNLRFRQSGKMGLPCRYRIKPILSCRRRFCFGYIINLLLTHDGCLLARCFYFAFFCTKNDVEVDKICKQNQTSVVNNTYNL